ncbi:MAG: hypothetical protein KDC44_10895, partial [Phaeodactylibacter sp.]|nr:hypothetical protein [Phaeodactylibacter sp.]
LLMQDAWRTRSWWDKLRIWFMPTGWRPKDVVERYPVEKIEDVYHFDKYDSQPAGFMRGWVWFQFLTTLILMLFLFFRFAEIGFPGLFLYGGFLFLGVYGYSSLMDRERIAPWIELVRGLIGFGYVLYVGDWFTMNALWPFGSYLIASYFLLTAIVPLALSYSTKWMKEPLPE